MGGTPAPKSEIILLLPEDADRVREISGRHYPENFSQDDATIEHNLGGAWNNTFCFGLERGTELVGYMMAWLGDTYIKDRTERVMIVDDLVLEPSHRRYLFRLLDELRLAAEEAELDGIPVEGVLRSCIADNIVSHPNLLAKLGYEIVAAHRSYDERLGEDMVWVRFELIGKN
jgi:hypothetical protein